MPPIHDVAYSQRTRITLHPQLSILTSLVEHYTWYVHVNAPQSMLLESTSICVLLSGMRPGTIYSSTFAVRFFVTQPPWFDKASEMYGSVCV